ncbi:hypothetical protein BIV57_16605 [Mangrovactinospora gilvigrisea]|uniref:Major facilitator superfamily (MFS) profile domain-containing protein n=1 Tax=Mangrovactinospora gilvigrisea TaxID=1428644 RepID=A0A1J7BCR3_9ACTN|nr:hypothetical protein BIV57_16605 [Mangrovactinospora gilvigrisea]
MLSGAAATTAAGDDARGARRALAVVCAGTVAVLIHFTMPLLIPRQIAAGLHAGSGGAVWLMSGMSLGLAAALLPTGALADDRGRRRVFTAGAALLAAATVLCAAAPDGALFTAGRILQGAAGAAVLAAGLGLVADSYREPFERARAIGLWGAALGLGIAVGPVLMAYGSDAGGWRTPFWVMAAASAAVAGLGLTLRRDTGRPDAERRPVDAVGALLLAAALAAIVAGCALGRSGWTRPQALVPLLAGVALLGAFFAAEARQKARGRAPMLDPALLAHRGFAGAAVGALATGLAPISLVSYLPTPLEAGLGTGASVPAWLIFGWSGLSVVTATFAPRARLLRAVGARTQVAAGLAVSGIGLAGTAALAAAGAWQAVLPGLAVSGVATGVLNGGLGRLAVESAPEGSGGLASGVNNTARYTGSSIGTAVVVSVAAPAGSLHGFGVAAGVTAGLALLGAALVRRFR